MIRRLRRRHLVLGVAVLATAPALVALAVGVRAARPWNESVPGLNTGAPPTRLAGLPVEVRLDLAAGTFAFRSTDVLRIPDPLLYWTPTPTRDSLIPAGAVFLGPLSADRFIPARAPLAALAPGGAFLIWDGGHRRLVANATADLPRAGGSAP